MSVPTIFFLNKTVYILLTYICLLACSVCLFPMCGRVDNAECADGTGHRDGMECMDRMDCVDGTVHADRTEHAVCDYLEKTERIGEGLIIIQATLGYLYQCGAKLKITGRRCSLSSPSCRCRHYCQT